jgi:hypothetical protein
MKQQRNDVTTHKHTTAWADQRTDELIGSNRDVRMLDELTHELAKRRRIFTFRWFERARVFGVIFPILVSPSRNI